MSFKAASSRRSPGLGCFGKAASSRRSPRFGLRCLGSALGKRRRAAAVQGLDCVAWAVLLKSGVEPPQSRVWVFWEGGVEPPQSRVGMLWEGGVEPPQARVGVLWEGGVEPPQSRIWIALPGQCF